MESNLLSIVKSSLNAHWRAVIGKPEFKAQWMPQEYGVTYWEPQHERSLHLLLEEVEAEAERLTQEKLEEVERFEKDVESLTQKIVEIKADAASELEDLAHRNAFLTKHNAELQERLNDALNTAAPKLTTISTVISEDPLVIVDKDVPDDHNGVTPPKSGATKTTWDAADAYLLAGVKPTRAQVVEAAAGLGVKEATAAAAYSQWAKYHSINPKDPTKPFELKEKRKGEAAKREEETKPATRYFSHPESSCVFMTHDGSFPDGDDGNVVELTKDEYLAEIMNCEMSVEKSTVPILPPPPVVLPPPPVVILPPPPPPF